jgi:hypothetical protein
MMQYENDLQNMHDDYITNEQKNFNRSEERIFQIVKEVVSQSRIEMRIDDIKISN